METEETPKLERPFGPWPRYQTSSTVAIKHPTKNIRVEEVLASLAPKPGISERYAKAQRCAKARPRYQDQYKSKSGAQVVNCLVEPEAEKKTLYCMEQEEVKVPRPRVLLNDRLEADKHLRAMLQDEACFLPRVPTLFRQLKLKCKQILSRYDLSLYSAEEIRVMKTKAIGAAMIPSPEELSVMATLQGRRTAETIRQFNSFLDGQPTTFAGRVKSRLKSYLPA